jgi:hypothetical protein
MPSGSADFDTRGSIVGDPQNVVAPAPPPSGYADAPQYAAPGPNYVWAPGYWWWSGNEYVWVAGDWLPARPGYVYLGPRWARTGYGWEFSAGGWARGDAGIVIYPVYRHPYGRYQTYNTPGYDSHRRLGDPGYSRYHGYAPASSGYSRQEVHVTPQYPGHGSYRNSYTAPPRAPTVPDRVAPTAGPRTGHSTPPVTQAIRVGGGGGRSPQRATVRARH